MDNNPTLHSGKLDELRSAFATAQQAMPFLEQIVEFIQEIEPLLDEINSSIRESTRKMPRATSQLESVTEATELATTEIMDLTDEVFETVETLKSHSEGYQERLNKAAASDERLQERLQAELDPDDHAELLETAEQHYADKQEFYARERNRLDDEQEHLNAICERLNHIMMSLQVQDITSQQIAAVNHLIGSIRDRMKRLIRNLEQEAPASEEWDDDAGPSVNPKTFDKDAEYDRSGQRQQDADEVVASFNGAAPPASSGDGPTRTNADDSADAASEDAHDDTGDATSSGGFERASQDEIDELFG